MKKKIPLEMKEVFKILDEMAKSIDDEQESTHTGSESELQEQNPHYDTIYEKGHIDGYDLGFQEGVDSVTDDMIPGLSIPTLREKILNRMYTQCDTIAPADLSELARTLLVLIESDIRSTSIVDDTEKHS